MSLRPLGQGLLIIRPKESMLRWLNSLSDSNAQLKLEKLRKQPSAVIIPALASEAEVLQFLESHLDRFFEHALLAWSLDLNAWPKKRDLRSFREMFEVELCSSVFDMGQPGRQGTTESRPA